MVDGVANTTTAYAYDAVNRLTGATRARTGTDTRTASYAYGYDATGNRTSMTVGGVGTSASFNEADEETSWNTGLNRTYAYDANGNELGSSQGESRGYNSRNQTISITGLNLTSVPMTYLDSGQGERTSAGTSQYLNSSLGVGSETKNNQTTSYTRTPSGHLVSERTPSATYYYLFDGLGSVVGLVDTGGNVVARYGYDPYGQTVVKEGAAADGNPWRYTGAYLDATGLYKLGARYYDPAKGRFTQLDPLGSGYTYASDNPVNFTDPTGLCPDNAGCNDQYDNGPGGAIVGGGDCGCGYAGGGYSDDGRDAGFHVLGNDDGTGHAGGGGPTRTVPPYVYPPGTNGVGLGDVCKAFCDTLPPIRPPTVGDPRVIGEGLADPRDWRSWINIILGGGINWSGW